MKDKANFSSLFLEYEHTAHSGPRKGVLCTTKIFAGTQYPCAAGSSGQSAARLQHPDKHSSRKLSASMPAKEVIDFGQAGPSL